jgi:hypothetical protein
MSHHFHQQAREAACATWDQRVEAGILSEPREHALAIANAVLDSLEASYLNAFPAGHTFTLNFNGDQVILTGEEMGALAFLIDSRLSKAGV